MGHLETHSHKYQTFRTGLSDWQMTKLIYKIQNSDRFQVGDLSHIHVRGSNVCVGYLGDDSAEFVDPDRTETRAPRRQLKRYFRSV